MGHIPLFAAPLQCRFHSHYANPLLNAIFKQQHLLHRHGKRLFSTQSWLYEKPLDSTLTPTSEKPQNVLPSSSLHPSRREAKRWRMIDNIMLKFNVASDRINKYTGTDYSSIEALRAEIKHQEQLVRARQEALQTAKSALEASHDHRTLAAKSVVALLERKASWTAADIDTYTTLIRSEHLHDQAVESDKRSLQAAEQSLEDARLALERRERTVFREQQDRSDTIQRNSTWVAVGLAVVNILGLVVGFVGVEPWRRKRLVAEMERMMDRREEVEGVLMVDAADLHPVDESSTAPEASFDDASESAPNVALDTTTESTAAAALDAAADVSDHPEALSLPTAISNIPYLASILDHLHRPFGDQIVSIRKTDLSAIVLHTAALSATIAWIIATMMSSS